MNEAADTMTVKMKAMTSTSLPGDQQFQNQQRRHHDHFGGVEAAEEAGIERRDGPRPARLDQHRREKQAGAYDQDDDDHHEKRRRAAGNGGLSDVGMGESPKDEWPTDHHSAACGR